ncbi:MAG TPA: hypothetical protein VHN74_00890 [Candidatus Angelobacter sp.]|jgi:hypothetical protein|nr:hypothetical protein [Candidatus Angelobacter sp.]
MFLHYLARVLEVLFFVGLVGSLVVAVLAFVGDLHVFFEDDKVEDSGRSVPAPGIMDAEPHTSRS